jgi:hypothetical protein
MDSKTSHHNLYSVSFAPRPTPEKLGQAVRFYRDQADNPKVFSKAETALRIFVAGVGGPRRSGQRATDAEKQAIRTFIERFDFSKVWQQDPLEALERGFKRLKVNPTSQRTYRSQFNHLLAFWKAQGWDPRVPEHQVFLRMNNPWGMAKPKIRRKHWSKAPKIILAEWESPDRLNDEFKAFKAFCLNVLNLSERGYAEDFLRRYLGMLCREGMALEQVSLSHLIPYVKPADSLDIQDVTQEEAFKADPIVNAALEAGRFLEALAISKEVQRKTEKQTVKHVEQLFQRFASYTFGQSVSRRQEVHWLIRLTKYVYRDDIQELGPRAIPILQFLQQLRQQLQQKAKGETSRLPYEEGSLNREPLLEMLYRLKHLATQEKDVHGKRDLTLSTRALNIQRFLILALLSVLPPRRRRVIAELSLDKTFRQGLRIDRRFVPVAELRDPSQAMWYYTLDAEAYKTGRTKGKDWSPIVNWQFGDGTALYDYIDIWLTELRPLLKPQHDFVFVKPGFGTAVAGTPISSDTVYNWCRQVTERHTDTAVAVKTFRKMYVTYVKSIPDVTEAELDAIAAAMGHSREMQEKVYNQLGNDETVAPVIDFQRRINQNYLENGGSTSPWRNS